MLAVIPAIVLLFWARNVLHAMPVTDANALPLWDIVLSVLTVLPSWLNFILLFALISWEAIYLNNVMNRFEVLYKNSFLPGLLFALLISSTPHLMQFHPVHLINLIVLRILDRSFMLYKNEMPMSSLFDSAFLSGIAALIYFPSFVFLLFLIIMLIVLLPFRIREWIIMFIGFFLPYFFISTIFFWNHELGDFWRSYIERFGRIVPEWKTSGSSPLIALAITSGTILLFSLIKLRINYRKNVIRTRNFQQLLFYYFLVGIIWLLLCTKIEVIHVALLLVPVATFSAYYFLSAKRKIWIYETALWGLVAIMLWNHLAG